MVHRHPWRAVPLSPSPQAGMVIGWARGSSPTSHRAALWDEAGHPLGLGGTTRWWLPRASVSLKHLGVGNSWTCSWDQAAMYSIPGLSVCPHPNPDPTSVNPDSLPAPQTSLSLPSWQNSEQRDRIQAWTSSCGGLSTPWRPGQLPLGAGDTFSACWDGSRHRPRAGDASPHALGTTITTHGHQAGGDT